jgi:hypothetical protein
VTVRRPGGPALMGVLLAALFAAACAPSPGEQVAARIRAAGSSLIRDVTFRAPNMVDPASVDVWLRPGATEAQADALWCEVIAPAGGSAFEGDTEVVVWNDQGTEPMALSPSCPVQSG